jgi:hypothetical protein
VLTCSPLSCLTVSIRHDISTLTNLSASGSSLGIGGKDDVTFGLISFSTFPWLVFILLGMCFVRFARANLSFLSSASGRTEVVLEAFATAVVAAGCSGEGKGDLFEDADDKEDNDEDEEEDELEIVLFRLVDTAMSSSISSNSS